MLKTSGGFFFLSRIDPSRSIKRCQLACEQSQKCLFIILKWQSRDDQILLLLLLASSSIDHVDIWNESIELKSTSFIFFGAQREEKRTMEWNGSIESKRNSRQMESESSDCIWQVNRIKDVEEEIQIRAIAQLFRADPLQGLNPWVHYKEKKIKSRK